MVDRITPVTTDEVVSALSERFDVQDRWPVAAEPFTSWVLEEAFADGARPSRMRECRSSTTSLPTS